MSSLNHYLRRLWKFPQAMVKGFMVWTMRILMRSSQPRRLARSGFVLPTTTMLLLMVLLTASALTYRSFSRTQQVIATREQKVVMNSATPAVERAKAKLEYMFTLDKRIPQLPSSDVLIALLSDPSRDLGASVGITKLSEDFYTLPGETRVDIDGDGKKDNAWMFAADINGDGTVDANERVAYSILMDDVAAVHNNLGTGVKVEDALSQNKAKALVMRSASFNASEATSTCGTGRAPEGGWQKVNSRDGGSSALERNFQINVFTVGGGNSVGRTVETMEYQQSRRSQAGNKWGAWFRYDIEFRPGDTFNWNGSIHTDGSMFLRNDTVLHMISSHNSCLYSRDSSEITLGEETVDLNGLASDKNEYTFQGQFVRATISANSFDSGDTSKLHLYNGLGEPSVGSTAPGAKGAWDITKADGFKIDSVRKADGTEFAATDSPLGIAMDPMRLFTKDESVHLNGIDSTLTGWRREAAATSSDGKDWIADRTGALTPSDRNDPGRIYNDANAVEPYIDDFYRADNRWGPKPTYRSPGGVFKMSDPNGDGNTTDAVKSGDAITGIDQLTNSVTGLDGYWERQAINNGLRLIVGERLQLGNRIEWNFDPIKAGTGNVPATNPTPFDSLYPPTALHSTVVAGNLAGGPNEVRQRRSLRDNLAAVQSMAVYHYQTNSGTFPAACMALTAHPGTRQTIIDSRTFTNSTAGNLKVDFLNGKGTNGWEFRYPAAFSTEANFATEIGKARPLGIALRNLAQFAGDPSGGAPSFPAVQDAPGASAVTHPFPFLSMWGDFSNLRRVLARVDSISSSSTAYNTLLSPADKTTLHTAACTLGLLAYSFKEDLEAYEALLSNASSNLQSAGVQLAGEIGDIIGYMDSSMSARAGNPQKKTRDLLVAIGKPTYTTSEWPDSTNNSVSPNQIAGCTTDNMTRFDKACDTADYFKTYTTADWVNLYKESANPTPSAADVNAVYAAIDILKFGNSLIRDRELGFRVGLPSQSFVFSATPVTWDPITGNTGAVQVPSVGDSVFNTGCNPNIFEKYVNQGQSDTGANGRSRVALALMVCNETTQMKVKFPSLYYLFPLVEHDQLGTGYHKQPDGTIVPAQATEPYIDQAYIKTINPTSTIKYKIIGTKAVSGVAEIALVPSAAPTTACSDTPGTYSGWIVPACTSGTTLTDPNSDSQTFLINRPGGGGIRVPFLDKGMFDGRENLSLRVLDIDIKTLTTKRNGTTGDYWLPSDTTKKAEGVIYAFREDAIREDEIVRPRATTWSNCNTFAKLTNSNLAGTAAGTTASCQMNPFTPQDPPLNADNLVSVKPIDMYPDPDRRVHGFRLRNALDFSGPSTTGSSATLNRPVGMTLVTDNPVYIQGNFNLHSTDGTLDGYIEEFTQTLNKPTVSGGVATGLAASNKTYGQQFYTDRTTQQTGFADLLKDHWRPVEIMADSITILSNNFKDGAIADTFLRTSRSSSSPNQVQSSYENQNRPTDRNCTSAYSCLTSFILEDGTFSPATGVDASTRLTVPVWIDRNGVYRRRNHETLKNVACETLSPVGNLGCVAEYIGYGDTSSSSAATTHNNGRRQHNQFAAEHTYVNAVFVGNVLPARANQSYGGFENYPRLLENWSNKFLVISGSFFQFGFNATATGPFDPDAWEVGRLPQSSQWNHYYDQPNRRWGYDVALQYVPPAPIARRLEDITSPRSEYYTELPADDPYIKLLRCIKMSSTERLDPVANNTMCPY